MKQIEQMKTFWRSLRCAMLLMAAVAGISLASCSSDDDPARNDVTLEDAKADGTVVVLSFTLDGIDYQVAFKRVGDDYVLLDSSWTRAGETSEYNFMVEEDKANDMLRVYVREKDGSTLVLTLVVDFKASTIEIIPGNSQVKVTGVKMKIADVEITSQLETKTVSLADALVKGSTVVITCKWNGNGATVFTFTNNGGTFGCKIEGYDKEFYQGSLSSSGSTLTFAADNWNDSDACLKIVFNLTDNTYRFLTVRYSTYNSHTVSINGTDITSSLTEKRQ